MPYVPSILRNREYEDIAFAGWESAPTRLTIVRRVRVQQFECDAVGGLRLYLEGRAAPIYLHPGLSMRFGTESITAADYAWRVLESGDLIDLVYEPGERPIKCFWVHIEYVDSQVGPPRRSYKDDGHFALRTKAGEKAERMVANDLATRFGHSYPAAALSGTGTFQIRYAGKRIRRPDLRCLCCGLFVEVKRRNRDTRYRVSHSAARPFATENLPEDWHAFVFPDLSVHYVANDDLLSAIRDGRFTPGRDRYDEWADVDGNVSETNPPSCPDQPH